MRPQPTSRDCASNHRRYIRVDGGLNDRLWLRAPTFAISAPSSPSALSIRRVTTLGLLLVAVACARPNLAAADPGDDILVVPPAGSTSAIELNVDLSRSAPTVRSRRRPIATPELALRDLRDLKVVGDQYLLAENGPLGTAIIDDTLSAVFRFRPLNVGHTSAAVAGYGESGRIERVLTASSAAGRATIVDRDLQTTLWSYSVTEPTARPAYRKAIALPGGRVALALDWPTGAATISYIDVIDLETGRVIRLASRQYAGAPADLRVQPAIDGIRDLFATSPNTFLFVTPRRLGKVELDGDLVWSIQLDDRSEFGGEFAGVTQTQSGDIAVATRTPDRWLEAGPDHQVYWLDDASRDVLASSGVLSVAPVGIELGAGHGGSGTFGFEPDASFLPLSTVGDGAVSASVRIEPTPVVADSTARSIVDLLNPNTTALVLEGLQVVATPGSCRSSSERTDSQQTQTWSLTAPRDVALQAGRSRQIAETFDTSGRTPDTSWCARISALNADGERIQLGGSTSFRVIDANSDAGPNLQDLGFYNPNNPGQRTPPDDIPTGCGCGSSRSPLTPLSTGLFVLVIVSALSRRRR